MLLRYGALVTFVIAWPSGIIFMTHVTCHMLVMSTLWTHLCVFYERQSHQSTYIREVCGTCIIKSEKKKTKKKKQTKKRKKEEEKKYNNQNNNKPKKKWKQHWWLIFLITTNVMQHNPYCTSLNFRSSSTSLTRFVIIFGIFGNLGLLNWQIWFCQKQYWCDRYRSLPT